MRAALALKGRLDGYADLALRVDLALARRRIALAERRVATVPGLVRRANGAVDRMDAARRRVVAMGGIVVRVVRRPRGAA